VVVYVSVEYRYPRILKTPESNFFLWNELECVASQATHFWIWIQAVKIEVSVLNLKESLLVGTFLPQLVQSPGD
jgi:hypothetical protein